MVKLKEIQTFEGNQLNLSINCNGLETQKTKKVSNGSGTNMNRSYDVDKSDGNLDGLRTSADECTHIDVSPAGSKAKDFKTAIPHYENTQSVKPSVSDSFATTSHSNRLSKGNDNGVESEETVMFDNDEIYQGV